ncbi:hypothetical protein MSAN_01747000 [Mycena sanguinolenta]|uniref:Uncharacterized protein n=1 Tax=Mycena sanguinolenta TaxID=230812 RepID=A0A8H7CRU5_9AGAR|nr:hypothetical protein MSAN_01747000 [Mycena sanguinolenta]
MMVLRFGRAPAEIPDVSEIPKCFNSARHCSTKICSQATLRVSVPTVPSRRRRLLTLRAAALLFSSSPSHPISAHPSSSRRSLYFGHLSPSICYFRRQSPVVHTLRCRLGIMTPGFAYLSYSTPLTPLLPPSFMVVSHCAAITFVSPSLLQVRIAVTQSCHDFRMRMLLLRQLSQLNPLLTLILRPRIRQRSTHGQSAQMHARRDLGCATSPTDSEASGMRMFRSALAERGGGHRVTQLGSFLLSVQLPRRNTRPLCRISSNDWQSRSPASITNVITYGTLLQSSAMSSPPFRNINLVSKSPRIAGFQLHAVALRSNFYLALPTTSALGRILSLSEGA